MYMGEYSHSIDAKGRVIVPTKLREALGENFVVTIGLDGCLYVYDAAEWERIVDKIKNLPTNTSVEARKKRVFNRTFYAGADTPVQDKMGRIIIPQALRDHADLKKDVVIVGVGDHVEIWDKERWENEASADIDEIAAGLEEIGLML
jgi:MraZ protein